MMPISVKGDDIRSGTKAKACHSQFGMGVNGLILYDKVSVPLTRKMVSVI